MECNKEEALRAKGIAERKMQIKDFVGARKIILKAQQLFPDLENISQMLTVCDVHCSAELNTLGSEKDWYGILQLDQTADELSIKKQYRKFALLLHPDKNKFGGAEAAFKLIGEAQRVLCDREKRSLYDMKRRPTLRTVAQRQPPHQANRSSYARKQPGVPNNFTYHATPQFTGFNHHQQQQTQTTFSNAPTFWTKCPHCNIRYQYFKDILNRSLRCQTCTKLFIAHDLNVQGVPAGENSGSTTWYRSAFPQHNENLAPDGHRMGPQSTAGNASNMGFQMGSGSEAGVGNKGSVEGTKNRVKLEEGTKRAQAGNQSGNASRKRGRKVVTESSESCDTESTDSEDEVVEEVGLSTGQNPGMASSHRYPRRSSRQKQQVSYNYKDDVSDDDDDDFVIEANSKKSRGNGSSGGVDNENSKPCSKEDADIINGSANGTAVFEDKKEDGKEGCVPLEENLPNGKEQTREYKENGKEQSGIDKKVDGSKPKSNSKLHSEILSYPEPEFYDFDQDRKESRFSPEQIWAAYDDAGGMPRYYVRIRTVSPGFKLQITWLEFNPNPKDQHEIDWYNENLPAATGTFKHGKTETITDHAIFSHMIYFEKGKSRGSYKIYPVKGQIWALFKDWDIKWSSDPDIHRHYEFDYVEVISDYAEGLGIRVNYLVKVEGFKFLFRRMENKEMQIPSNELMRFSHMVPSYRMTGDERESIPGGSFELDPASLPSDNEESPFSERFNDVKAYFETVDAQSNGCCSRSAAEKKPATGSVMPETIKKSKELNEKKIQGKENLPNINGNQEKKPGVSDSTKSRATEKDDILGDGVSSPNNAFEHSDSSPADSPKAAVYEYPDPEFYNFDADRSKDKFEPGQLWALYNDIDGMPTFYARIKKVERVDFKVHITWLESCPMIEEEIKWSEVELPIGCGTFKASSDSQIYDTTETFSHQIRVQPTWKKNRYEIYPRKGEVWAVYKNWSIELARDDLENCEYEMVEVFSESSFEMTVLVLKKVEGHKTVFEVQRKGGEAFTMSIPRNEWLRFAHKIPAFRLTEEKGGKLRGCLELDPASTPAILFCTSSD